MTAYTGPRYPEQVYESLTAPAPLTSLLHMFIWSPELSLVADSALSFAISQANLAGKLILLLLLFGSVFAWYVMVNKISQIRDAAANSDRFLARLRKETSFVELFNNRKNSWPASPILTLYETGCKKLQESSSSPALRVEQLKGELERTVGEQSVNLESQVSLLGTVVSAAPFLGLLGTVWGVMDAFTGVANAGTASIGALAPGVSGALITTVGGLVVAIPSMIGYNYLLTKIRHLTVMMDNFASEFVERVEKELKGP
jgi:biopolymer transport protein TolQ